MTSGRAFRAPCLNESYFSPRLRSSDAASWRSSLKFCFMRSRTTSPYHFTEIIPEIPLSRRSLVSASSDCFDLGLKVGQFSERKSAGVFTHPSVSSIPLLINCSLTLAKRANLRIGGCLR